MVMPKNQVVRKGGRFAGTKGLTDQQAVFVRQYVSNGGNGAAAATAAKYAGGGQAAYDLLRNPKICAAIHDERKRVIGNLATAGLGVIGNILDGTIPVAGGTLLDAAKFVIGLAGHVTPKDGTPDKEDKPLESMTIQEMEDFIRRGEEALKLAGQPVIDGEAVAPAVAPSGSQAVDITPKDSV